MYRKLYYITIIIVKLIWICTTAPNINCLNKCVLLNTIYCTTTYYNTLYYLKLYVFLLYFLVRYSIYDLVILIIN